VIEPDRNGYMLPLKARGREYAELIKELYEDDQKYYQLIRTSRETFEKKLNWDNWGKEVNSLIKELLNK
jgi:glycosyltransferase involved in cell wall biosynthesis